MKERLLFLAKLALISAVSFYLWKSFASRPYTLLLNRSIGFIRPLIMKSDANLKILDKVPYFYLVFFSLVLASPPMPIFRRIKIFLGGTLLFFAFDFFTVFFGLTTVIGKDGNGYLSAAYHTSLPILAVALWIVPNLSQIGSLFERSAQLSSYLKPARLCPICKKEKAGLVDHIRSAHGEKSLRSWKVRRFLARRSLT